MAGEMDLYAQQLGQARHDGHPRSLHSGLLRDTKARLNFCWEMAKRGDAR